MIRIREDHSGTVAPGGHSGAAFQRPIFRTQPIGLRLADVVPGEGMPIHEQDGPSSVVQYSSHVQRILYARYWLEEFVIRWLYAELLFDRDSEVGRWNGGKESDQWCIQSEEVNFKTTLV